MADPCRAYKSFQKTCDCVEYAKGDRVGQYTNCAVCGHSQQIHYTPSGEKKVKR